MAYKTAGWGPGSIASLPATIGATSRAPTIGSEDPGRKIPLDWDNRYAISGCSGCGVGTNGDRAAALRISPLAIGSGFVLGGLLMWLMWGREKPLMGML